MPTRSPLHPQKLRNPMPQVESHALRPHRHHRRVAPIVNRIQPVHAQFSLNDDIVTFNQTVENVRRQLAVTNNIAPRHNLSLPLPLLTRRSLLVLNHTTQANGCPSPSRARDDV